MGQIYGVLAGGLYIVCNYFIANIPCWHIRKIFYRMLGMKIGKGSRIMMKAIVTHPWKIEIGTNTTINEYCYLDGRGGLKIGDNVNIALHSMLVTGSHHIQSRSFEYYAEPVIVEDEVWIGSRSTVLNGCILKRGSIVAAGAVISPHFCCEVNRVYGGIPAKCIRDRCLAGPLELDRWIVHFR